MKASTLKKLLNFLGGGGEGYAERATMLNIFFKVQIKKASSLKFLILFLVESFNVLIFSIYILLVSPHDQVK